MKWFEKHSNDRNRLDSKLIQRKFGIAGYGIYEKLQQIAAENMEGDEINEWGLVAREWTMEKLAEEIGCDLDVFQKFVKFCDDNLILERKNGRLFVPIMLERMNEYAKRQYRKSIKASERRSKKSTDTTDNTDTSDNRDISATQHNTSQHNTSQTNNNGASPKIKSSGPGTIGEVLSSYEIPHEKESERVKTGWQFRAIEWAKDLGIDLDAGTPKQNYRARWFKVFKEADGSRQKNIKLHDAYTNLRDYPRPLKSVEKINMFFFLYNGNNTSSAVQA